jgi:Uma2 family endonuclease
MTYEEFLEWADEDTRAEWLDGEVIVLMPPSLLHQRLIRFLSHLLGLFVALREVGEVLVAPFQMKLAFRPSGREPDLIFVAREHLDRLTRMYLDGPADLAVEIVSEDSRTRDRRDKYQEYEAAGVREYWLIDPDTRQAEFFGLGPEGRYQSLPVDEAGVFHSRVVPGFWLRVEWLWRDPPPDLEALRALGVLSTAPRAQPASPRSRRARPARPAPPA